MKEQCPVCGSTVDNVAGVCPVCGSLLVNKAQTGDTDSGRQGEPGETSTSGLSLQRDSEVSGGTDGSGGYGTSAGNIETPAGNVQPDGYGAPAGNVQPGGYGAPAGNVQPGGYGAPAGNVQSGGYGAPAGNVQPNGYGAPAGNVQPGGYGTPAGNSQPGGMYGGQYQQPYNYQNPNGIGSGAYAGGPGANGPQKKVFSILSLVCSLVSILTCCVPGLGLVLGIAAIVFAIVAMVKKQSKVPAVIGLILGIIGTLAGFGAISFNLMMKSQIGTSFSGLMQQLVEVQSTGITELEDIIFLNPADNEYYALYSDGTYETSDYGYGSYDSYSYMDYYNEYSDSNAVTYGIIYAMQQGYQVKDVTILDFPDASYMFIVPSDFAPGDTIYYVEYPNNYTDMNGYKLVPVVTEDLYSYSY